MQIEDLTQLYSKSPQVDDIVEKLGKQPEGTLFLKSLVGGALSVVIAALQERVARTILLVLADDDEAAYVSNDLARLTRSEVYFYPSSYKRNTRVGDVDAANEILRTEILSRLSAVDTHTKGSPITIVTYPRALEEMVVRPEDLKRSMLRVNVGQELHIADLEERLSSLGFTRTDYVYEPGQMAIRGSIVDVYSYSSELPYRIDFFDNEVDSIRTFELDSQLSREKKTQVSILPDLNHTQGTLISMAEFLPTDALIVTSDLDYVEGYGNRLLVYGPNPPQTTFDKVEFDVGPQPLFHKNFQLLRTTLTDYQEKGYHCYILADSDKQHQRLRDILSQADDGSFSQSTTLPTPVSGTLHEGFVDKSLKCCFLTDHQIFDRFHKYHLKSDYVRTGKASLTLKELGETQVGDYLVHVDFGIGRFGGLVRKPTGRGYIEEIRLVYQRGDIVDISIHSLHKISKYRRNGDNPPRLSTLGTGAWERLKDRTKRHIKDIARDLITLYAQRRQEKGFAFSADSYMQHELEASFVYEDTPDQLHTTQEVKTDMESDRPMDRLICGDVGFGKTEIAVRAAFKACCDNKQVALLVPTTVLAFQHYQTFSARLKDFPVRIEYLSRARNAKKTREILADLEAGKIDILIGTHKMISHTVKWHDLGLLIVDEEQKFGVSVKEKLRQLRTNIDTITMTATPIPRTLQFSLMGARDMSIMRTPPPNRYPITTILTTFNKEVIAEAIRREIDRNGQVFVVNDRVSNLTDIASIICQEVPDCRLAIGHGQMNPEELEKVLIGFINYDYDVLLSTTIIENGVDIPNANTIIINDAHHFGLSDLHQMRGRVGRTNRKAYCYLVAPPLSALPQDARRRLEAVETFADLGAGFALSMQDLDIRGAGNLLGAEQSGFIEDLGYETYQKILSQAVTELKNEEFQDLYAEEISQGKEVSAEEFVADCTVESDLEMYFPDEYVPTSAERMLLYRELDNIETDEALAAYRNRLEDRFGPVPHEGEELMNVVLLRRYGRRAGCEKIMLKKGLLNMQFVSNPDSAFYDSPTFGRVLHFASNNSSRCQFKEVNSRRFMHVKDVTTVAEAVDILRTIAKKD